MATVLIVGCGYLGTRIVPLLQERGDRVLATTRKPERAELFRVRGIEPVLYDVLQGGPLPVADAVIHAVGLDRNQGASMHDVYVEGLARVLNATHAAPRFVHISSTSVYGQSDGAWLSEDAPTQPNDASGQIVLQAEQLLLRERPDAVVLRFAGIYGPGRRIGEAGLRAGKAVAADPDKWLNLIHVEDGADAVVAALDRGQGIYHIADGQPVLRRDYFDYLASLIGVAPTTFEPAGEATNRRIDARRMREELGVIPRYGNYRVGLVAC
ncbi:MAG: SDR family oxidoreductase [Gemmataceae bacterium]